MSGTVAISTGQLDECLLPPDTLEVPAASTDIPWQAAVAELVLLVAALSAENDAAAAINEVLPADLLTGANSSTSLVKK